jgi:hypothetical protein
LEQNSRYLKLAREIGYTRLFTSLHIPESSAAVLVREARILLQQAAELGFSVTADISPQTWDQFGISASQLAGLGIETLRIDYGIGPKQIKELAQSTGLRIEVNASTMTEILLIQMFDAGIDHGCLSACHNYYPRPETGLSYDLLVQRSKVFMAKNIPVAAFIPGRTNPRGPVYAGLPTLESHRNICSIDAARQLWASGAVDTIIWGDPLVSESELISVAQLPQKNGDPLLLRMVPVNDGGLDIEWLRNSVHTNRLDAAEKAVRSQESRVLRHDQILPQPAQTRQRGDVTIDNSNYGRYMGELQILLQDLPADERVNVIGRIVSEDLCLLECVHPGRRFMLQEVAGS